MHGRTAIATAALSAALFLALGCGGSGTGGTAGSGGGTAGGSAGTSGGGAGTTGAGGAVAPPAGVDGTKALSSATAADATATCDWYAMLVGGYGATSTCGSAALHAPPSQADCLATFPTCDVTFADFEACVVAVVRAQQACSATSVKDAESSDVCASVIPAGCF
jgi:hypothetical protein